MEEKNPVGIVKEKKTVGIVGVGWNGGHLSLVLSREGYKVTAYEKNEEIFNELSGNFGLRNHMGYHYLRSDETRKDCRETYDEFAEIYAPVINPHEHSIYGLGVEDSDADGKSPKVSADYFNNLAEEDAKKRFKVMENPAQFGHTNLATAIDTPEATIMVGQNLRSYFEKRLAEANVRIKVNTRVEGIWRNAAGKMVISANGKQEEFDYVINATAYNGFVSKNKEPLFGMDIVYQVCRGLIYEDTQEKEKGKTIPLIVMDGWYPCLMYYNDGEPKENSHYLLYHAKYSILDSCTTAEEAQQRLAELSQNKEVLNELERLSREHFEQFNPKFSKRFKYVRDKMGILAKINTRKEFRSAVTFQDEEEIIHIIPGKVQHCITIGKQVLTLLNPELHPEKIASENGYRYVKESILDRGKKEIIDIPTKTKDDLSRNTCSLHTATEIETSLRTNPSATEVSSLDIDTTCLGVSVDDDFDNSLIENEVLQSSEKNKPEILNKEAEKEEELHRASDPLPEARPLRASFDVPTLVTTPSVRASLDDNFFKNKERKTKVVVCREGISKRDVSEESGVSRRKSTPAFFDCINNVSHSIAGSKTFRGFFTRRSSKDEPPSPLSLPSQRRTFSMSPGRDY